MGAEQVASILRQAGQDSIRLIVARPVDPSVQSFAVRIFCYIIFWRNMLSTIILKTLRIHTCLLGTLEYITWLDGVLIGGEARGFV